MIPDEESGIRNGNVRVSKDFCHRFCKHSSIFRAKTPSFHFILSYIHILQVILSAPDAGTKLLYHDHVIAMVQVARTVFITKCEVFVIWTVLLAGSC